MSTLTKVFVSIVFRTRQINHIILMNYLELIQDLLYVAHARSRICNFVTQFSNMAPYELTVRASFRILSVFVTQICDKLIGMCKIKSTVQ